MTDGTRGPAMLSILDKIDQISTATRPGIEKLIESYLTKSIDETRIIRQIEEIYIPLVKVASTPSQHYFISLYAINGFCGSNVSFISRDRGMEYIETAWNDNSSNQVFRSPALLYARCLFAALKNKPQLWKSDEEGKAYGEILSILPDRDW
jgi:hypothetical protein